MFVYFPETCKSDLHMGVNLKDTLWKWVKIFNTCRSFNTGSKNSLNDPEDENDANLMLLNWRPAGRFRLKRRRSKLVSQINQIRNSAKKKWSCSGGLMQSNTFLRKSVFVCTPICILELSEFLTQHWLKGRIIWMWQDTCCGLVQSVYLSDRLHQN